MLPLALALLAPPELAPPPRSAATVAQKLAALDAELAAADRAARRTEAWLVTVPDRDKRMRAVYQARRAATQAATDRATALFLADPASADGLEVAQWIGRNVWGTMPADVVRALTRHHAARPGTGDLVAAAGQSFNSFDTPAFDAATEYLTAVERTNPDRVAVGQAVYHRAWAAHRQFLSADSAGRTDAGVLADRLNALIDRLPAGFAAVPTRGPYGKSTTYGALAAAMRPTVRVGQPAPPTTGVDLDGKPLDLAAFRGKVVVLYGWSPQHGFDKPPLAAWAERFRGRPFAVVAVCTGHDLPAARTAWAAKGGGWPSFAGRGADRLPTAVSSSWRFNEWGGQRVIDHRGVVRSMNLMGEGADPPTATATWPTDYLAELVDEAEGKTHPTPPAERLKALLAEASTHENRTHLPAYKLWTLRTAELVRRFPAEPAAFDLLASHHCPVYGDERAYLLRTHHRTHPKLDQAIHDLMPCGGDALTFAEDMAREHPDRGFRGRICYHIGHTAKVYRAGLQLPWHGYGAAGTAEELTARAEEYLTRAAREYADVPALRGDRPVGELAAWDLVGLRNLPGLAVGGTAPELAGDSLGGVRFRLSEYRAGRVAVVHVWSAYTVRNDDRVGRLKTLLERHGRETMCVLGVNCLDNLANAAGAEFDSGMRWPTLWDGGRGEVRAGWCIPTWPYVFVIDRAGVTRYADSGDGLEAAVEAAVGK